MLSIDSAIVAPDDVERATADDRRDVTATPRQAIDLVEDGMTVALGGFVTANHPMAMVRELIRADKSDLTIVGAATGGLDVDMLVGGHLAGRTSIEKLIAPYVGAELHLAVGHCFRKAVEEGRIDHRESSEYLLYAGLYAESMSMPFLPWRGAVGTSIPELNDEYVEFEDPLNGERLLAVPPLRPDVAIIHVNRADRFGNGQHLGATFGDRLMAQAADRVILTTEEVVDNDVIRENHKLTTIPYADRVVEARYGSHPFECHAAYRTDEDALNEYIEATGEYRHTGDLGALESYFDEYVLGPETHAEYLETIGIERLLDLERGGR